MWTLLRSPADWETYRQTVAQDNNAVGTPIVWGHGPRDYPCLVITYVPPRQPNELPKMISAYTYYTDIEPLLAALSEAGRLTMPAGVAAPAPELQAADMQQRRPTQDSFNRWVAALLLTHAHYLVNTGICRQEQYEDKLTEFLGLVKTQADQSMEAHLQRMRQAQEG